MVIDYRSSQSVPLKSRERLNRTPVRNVARLILWSWGAVLCLVAAWLLLASVQQRWLPGLIIGGFWVINVVINVRLIDIFLRKVM